jgi:hypothetical protein
MAKRVMIKSGYQPIRVQNGDQPSAIAPKGRQVQVSTPVETITPPRGGSGETVLKKKIKE